MKFRRDRRRSCVVCDDRGCEFCSRVEPWPDETFALLSDDDLDRLVVDASLELERRYVRLLELEAMWDA